MSRRPPFDPERFLQAFKPGEMKRGFPEPRRGRKRHPLPLIDRMKLAHENGHEFAALDALNLCREERSPIPNWVYKALNEQAQKLARGPRKPRAPRRHARAAARQADTLFDQYCYSLAMVLRRRGLAWKAVWIEAGEVFGVSCETIRKAYGRANKGTTEDFYFRESAPSC